LNQTELIKACKQNEYSAQLEVYNLFKKSLFNSSYRILKNKEDAEDVVHESFIKAFKKIEYIKDESNLQGWLTRITINESLNQLKKNKRIVCITDRQSEISLANSTVNNYKGHSIHSIMHGIQSLEDKYRLVVLLYLIEDCSHKEIAQFLNLNTSTVRSQYERGRKQLKKYLQKRKLE
jgi:RNA polymerase sigma-70 factor (ECF subfamily)